MNLAPLRPGGLLCLDLASRVGVAYGAQTDNLPEFWHFDLLKHGGEGARYASFENELQRIVETLEPCHVLLEAPLPLPAMTDARTARQQYTLRGFAYAECWRSKISITEISAITVRMEILGTARFGKGKVKNEVVDYCRLIGLDLHDHNDGDAVLLWLWRRVQMGGRRSAQAGPLFRERLY